MKYGLFFFLLLFSPLLKAQELYLIPTLHRLHLVNEQYNYDTLRQLIARINPDVIAVEIRTEDLDQDSAYLRRNYPYEMWMARYWFPDKTIAGFDWLGSDIAGKLIPENYWQEAAPVKKLQQALSKDSVYNSRSQACDTFQKERLALLQSLPLFQLIHSSDSLLTSAYYACLREQLKGSTYEALLDFYETRDAHILANIQALQSRYPNKTILVLTGDDHYIWLKGRLPAHHLPVGGR